MPWFAQGVDAANGTLSMHRSLWTGEPCLALDWDVETSKRVIEAVVAKHLELSAATGGHAVIPPTMVAAAHADHASSLGRMRHGKHRFERSGRSHWRGVQLQKPIRHRWRDCARGSGRQSLAHHLAHSPGEPRRFSARVAGSLRRSSGTGYWLDRAAQNSTSSRPIERSNKGSQPVKEDPMVESTSLENSESSSENQFTPAIINPRTMIRCHHGTPFLTTVASCGAIANA